MKSLRVIASLLTLLLLVSCATKASRADDESILDVIDAASSALQNGLACSASDVSYCLMEPSGLRSCTCVNGADLAQRLRPFAR